MNKLYFFLVSLLFFPVYSGAQTFDSVQAFAQGFYKTGGNLLRQANGAPGAAYWQNRVNYNLEAAFDTASHILTGTAIIHYYNNSPDKLQYLWLELDYNRDKRSAIGSIMRNPVSLPDTLNGFHFASIEVARGGRWIPVDYLVYDTHLQLKLSKALAGHGDSLLLRIKYHLKLLPKSAGGRAAIMKTSDGSIFELSYWYPRLCVYDDLHGWNMLPFIGGGEFYCEYGNFDYKITVPAGLLVASAGTLVNGKEILSDKVYQRLKKASYSPKTVIIRAAEDIGKISPTRKHSGRVTWHFKMKNTRDVAFAVSGSFIWDGARIDLPGGKYSFAQTFYPPKSALPEKGWQYGTRYLQAAVSDFSKNWFVYPYPKAVNVAGPVGGMEFPGITFDWHGAKGKSLWMIISHEIGHSWFPMIVGSNERRHPFMDEGFNTFIDIYAQAAFNHGEYAPKRDGEYAPHGGNPADEIIPVMKELQGSYTLMSAPDRMNYKYVHPLFYFKTAFGLVLLREVILGHQRFDYAFRTYIRDWAYKHPSPTDFFRTMDNASGTELTWFWRGWFYHNWLLDQAVKSVQYKDNQIDSGAEITIENKNKLVMPVTVLIKEANGEKQLLHLPVNIWTRGKDWTFHVATSSKVITVVLDPKHQLPDIDRKNNIWSQNP